MNSPIRQDGLHRALALLCILALLLWQERPVPTPSTLPDFTAISDVPTLKSRFYQFLRPMIEASNAEVSKKREQLLDFKATLDQGETLRASDKRRLNQLASEYGIDTGSLDTGVLLTELLHRVDSLPVPLMLVQAAQEGNNLFGLWCYTPGCGLVPSNRAEDANHEVRRFDSPAQSVASYLHNINTNPAYEELRSLRYQLRQAGKRVTGYTLANSLLFYSERREEYVEDIITMLDQYHQMMDSDA